MRTLAQVLVQEADQMIKSAEAIKRMVAIAKKSGMYWPEIDENEVIEGTEIIGEKRYR